MRAFSSQSPTRAAPRPLPRSTTSAPRAVSKAVSRLEAALAARLLTRTSRAWQLTEEGAASHECCNRALRRLAEAAEEVAGDVAPGTALAPRHAAQVP